MTAGIYIIKNTLANKVYVGSSKDIEKRFVQHKYQLKKGCHHSYKLQNAWDEYGENAFEFSVIEEVEESINLFEVEQQFIDEYRSWEEYNVCQDAGRSIGRPRSSDRQRLNLKLLPEVIKNMQAIAMSEGFVIKQGDRTGTIQNLEGKMATVYFGATENIWCIYTGRLQSV
jgi:group I intron endonuclease